LSSSGFLRQLVESGFFEGVFSGVAWLAGFELASAFPGFSFGFALLSVLKNPAPRKCIAGGAISEKWKVESGKYEL